MTDFEEVWRSSPPFLSIERAEVEHHGRAWTQHRLVQGRGLPGVVIIPVRGAAVGLVQVWRPAVGGLRLELPRGSGEDADPEAGPARDARRELREETGHHASALRKVGEFDLDTSLVPTRICTFVAAIDPLCRPEPTDGEAEDIRWVDAVEIPRLIADGAIRDAISLAALAQWRAASER